MFCIWRFALPTMHPSDRIICMHILVTSYALTNVPLTFTFVILSALSSACSSQLDERLFEPVPAVAGRVSAQRAAER